MADTKCDFQIIMYSLLYWVSAVYWELCTVFPALFVKVIYCLRVHQPAWEKIQIPLPQGPLLLIGRRVHQPVW